MIAAGAIFFLVMLLLMPRCAASLADNQAAGASATARRFSALHRFSVIINFAQMLAVLVVLTRLLV